MQAYRRNLWNDDFASRLDLGRKLATLPLTPGHGLKNL